MKIKQLIKDLPIKIYKGNRDFEITGITNHSKRTAPGNLFIAYKGTRYDGGDLIEEAVLGGAQAVLTDIPNPFLQNVVQLLATDTQSLQAILAKRFYQSPDQKLDVIGITGTNGKTTLSYMLFHLLKKRKTGLIGTIEYLLGRQHYPASLTTPDVISNFRMLKEMVREGCDTAIIEVTSHGLKQKRVDLLEFQSGVFTNLTPEHLDYHESMEEYGQTKALLFEKVQKDLIFNANCPWIKKNSQTLHRPIFWFGIDTKADLVAKSLLPSSCGTQFDLCYQNTVLRCKIPFFGSYNVSNFLGAASACLVRGISLEEIVSVAKNLPPVKGRLEEIENTGVFIDFAHTPDALKKAIQALKERTLGKIIVVFGCGGNRDTLKRSVMGKIASENADEVWITTDNSRSEDPHSICEEIASGCIRNNYSIEVDREQAIKKACVKKQTQDAVLIAGRGHESSQLLMHKIRKFNDYEVAKEVLQTLS